MNNKKLFKRLLFWLLLFSIILSCAAVIVETNILFKEPGSRTTYNFYVNDFVDDEFGGGYMRLTRNSETPLGVEYVTFDNADTYKFFSLAENQQLKEIIYITLPYNIEVGTYHYQLEIVINEKTFTKNMQYHVR